MGEEMRVKREKRERKRVRGYERRKRGKTNGR